MNFRFPIIKHSKLRLLLGATLIVLSWFGFLSHFNPSIEFTGGIEVTTYLNSNQKELDQKIQTSLNEANLKNMKVSSYSQGKYTKILIKNQSEQNFDSKKASSLVKSNLNKSNIISFSVNGPTISSYAKKGAIRSLIGGIMLVVIYMIISFGGIRHVMSPGILIGITILTMVFDVSIAIGGYGLAMIFDPTLQVDSIFIIVLLTVMGYSINDTIIVLDRIRENSQKNEKSLINGTITYASVFEDSIRQTMRRSIGTSLSTFLVVLSMYIFGTDVIKNFSFTMTIGIISGTTSSIFIAAPAVYLLISKKEKI